MQAALLQQTQNLECHSVCRGNCTKRAFKSQKRCEQHVLHTGEAKAGQICLPGKIMPGLQFYLALKPS